MQCEFLEGSLGGINLRGGGMERGKKYKYSVHTDIIRVRNLTLHRLMGDHSPMHRMDETKVKVMVYSLLLH